MGVVTPIGTTVAEFWAGCRERPGRRRPARRVRPGRSEDPDRRPDQGLRSQGRASKHFKRDKIILHADRYSWFAAAAADEAIKQSGLETPFKDGYRVACIIGSGAGGLQTMETSYRDLFILKKKATHPLTLLRFIGSSAAAHVGIEFGIKGPTFATCSACSTAAHAIGIGQDYIRHGMADVAIVGASESVINYGVMRAWQAMHVLSPEGMLSLRQEAQRHGAGRGCRHPGAGIGGARQGARRQDRWPS